MRDKNRVTNNLEGKVCLAKYTFLLLFFLFLGCSAIPLASFKLVVGSYVTIWP